MNTDIVAIIIITIVIFVVFIVGVLNFPSIDLLTKFDKRAWLSAITGLIFLCITVILCLIVYTTQNYSQPFYKYLYGSIIIGLILICICLIISYYYINLSCTTVNQYLKTYIVFMIIFIMLVLTGVAFTVGGKLSTFRSQL